MADSAGTVEKAANEAADQLQAKLEKQDRELAIERAQRIEAERRGNASAADAQRFREQATRSQADTVASSITRHEADAARLKKEKSAALAEGDFDKAADLDFQMSICATDLTNARNEKARNDADAQRAKDTPAPQPARGMDKAAFLAERDKTSPRSAAWLRAHDQFFTDDKFRSLVNAADNMAVSKGIVRDTEAYIDFVDKFVTNETNGSGANGAGGPRDVKTSPGGGADREIRKPGAGGEKVISADMRAAADICGVTPEQYYDEYVRLVGEEKIPDKFNVFGRR